MKSITTFINGASLSGLASFTAILALYFLFEANPLGPVKFLLLVFPIFFYALYLKKFRDEENGGFIMFSETLLPSFLFAFFHSSLIAMLCYGYIVFIDYQFFEMIRFEQLKALGMAKEFLINYSGKAVYQQALSDLESKGPFEYFFSDFFSKFMTVSIINLIIGAILRKSNPASPYIDEQS